MPVTYPIWVVGWTNSLGEYREEEFTRFEDAEHCSDNTDGSTVYKIEPGPNGILRRTFVY